MNRGGAGGKDEAAAGELESQPELGVLAEPQLGVEAADREVELPSERHVLGDERVARGAPMLSCHSSMWLVRTAS